MKNWIKKITGIAELEQQISHLGEIKTQEEEKIKALQEIKNKTHNEIELTKLTPKQLADKNKEPWVDVLDVKVNPENIRNGFFELDWNSYFIQELIKNGYGSEADPEEEIVDRWFRTIVYQMLEEEGMDTSRGSGYINVTAISDGKSEVS